jgi:putative oxidoreductase
MRRVHVLREHIDARRYVWFDLLRVVVGALLFAGGMAWAGAFGNRLLAQAHDGTWFSLGMWGHAIVGAHLVAGAFLMIGMLTRPAAALGFFAVVAALFTVGGPGGVVAGVAMAIACATVFFAGAGPWSTDARLEHHWLAKRAHVHDLDPVPSPR